MLGTIIAAACAVVGASVGYLWTQNNLLQISKHDIHVKNEKLSKELKVLHISDLHAKCFGKKQSKLIKAVRDIKPDIIVISGDIIYCYVHWYEPKACDKAKKNLKSSFCLSCPDAEKCSGYLPYVDAVERVRDFLDVVAKEFPVYYAPGNHEAKCIAYYSIVRPMIAECGVHILENESMYFNDVQICGICDPTFYLERYDWKSRFSQMSKITENALTELSLKSRDKLKLLIAHRPENFEQYSQNEYDIVFSGHAHGGQIRFPIFIKHGLYAPNQGFCPKLTDGVHHFGGTTLVISRGLGNSTFPFRVFNRPELVVVRILPEK